MEVQYRLVAIVKALRVHQWVKNLLLFIPLIMAHQWHDLSKLREACIAFLAFSVCASSVYIVNDLMDLESDRIHHTKKHRPFASGALSTSFGWMIAPFLFLLSLSLSYEVSVPFTEVVLGYFIVTTSYTFFLKRIVLLDIITLASLYSIRIFAGSVAVHTDISQWLLAFSMFLFFSLACVKRYSELFQIRKRDGAKAQGRGYLAHDLEMISQFGATSGYMSIVVLAFYLNSEEVRALYTLPKVLWLMCPAFFYWISRVWLIASRGEMHDDPIVFAIKDVPSYVVGVILMAIVCSAL